VRDACEALEREIAELRTQLALDREVYERLAALDPAAVPAGEPRRLLTHALRDFRRGGVDRDEATRAEIRRHQEELVRIGQEFDRNIVEGGREFVIAEGAAGLAGLPDDFVAAHPPRADGAVVLSTDPHDRMAFLTYAERDDLRREYFLACTNRAVPQNLEVLPRLIAKRHSLARLLGQPSWADFVTEDKMTRSAAAARAFLTRLVERVNERARAELAECLAKKRERFPDADTVHEWERAFLIERIKTERFEFDSRTVRSYFPLERVRAGVLDTAARLFGLEFRRDTATPVWHPSVETWEVREAGQPVGRFFLDLHPRTGKYKHAAMFPLTDGLAGETLPEAALVCNFPARSSATACAIPRCSCTSR
jgi:thimet oligopeptidase